MRLIDADELKQVISRSVADTNPDHFAIKTKDGYGKWMLHNGINSGLASVEIAIDKMIAEQPEWMVLRNE